MRAQLSRNGLGAALAVLLAVGVPGAAFGLDNDPVLRRYYTLGPNGTPVPDQTSFAKLSRELGMVLAPRLLAPAETLGLNGFQTGFEYSVTNISDNTTYWERGIDDESPPGTLMTTQLHVRKGLPYSFEIGGSATYLIDSEIWAFGGELKWALNEAVEAFPVDLAVHAAINRIIGSTELDMSVFGMDFVISRGFGVGGVANVAPYMAYNPVFVYARSAVLDATPGTADDPEHSFVLTEEKPVLHRFILGARFVFSALSFTPEVVLTRGLQTYNANLGLDF